MTRGVLYAQVEAEGKRLCNPFDTITEGVGLNRQTANFALAQVDDAFHCSDREAVEMSSFLVRNDGLFLGSSSAVNCVGAVRTFFLFIILFDTANTMIYENLLEIMCSG